MPYITPQDRLEVSSGRFPTKAGELNYVLTGVLDSWLSQVGVRYETINAVIGVLECAKLELYRRLAAPYEDEKIAENGDVYTTATVVDVRPSVIEVPNAASN
jgi:broad-specificity NMP kinase